MYLVTGAKGQLGTELSKRLPNAICVGHNELDITDEKAVTEFVKSHDIDTIINCAAYTSVDKAEQDIDAATKINITGPANLARACKLVGSKIVHISTDYVFNGNWYIPYKHNDPTSPYGVYGRTKIFGELAVDRFISVPSVIIRTSWLYSQYGNNFVKTMRRLGAERETVSVVDDQIGTPTYAGDLADAIIKIIPQINMKTRGIYHYSNMGVCSWYDFATEIMEMSELKCAVKPISTSEYMAKHPNSAPRPYYSVLDKSLIQKTFGIEIDHWKKSLAKCIRIMDSEKNK